MRNLSGQRKKEKNSRMIITAFGIEIHPLDPGESFVNLNVRMIAYGFDSSMVNCYLLKIKKDGSLKEWLLVGSRKIHPSYLNKKRFWPRLFPHKSMPNSPEPPEMAFFD